MVQDLVEKCINAKTGDIIIEIDPKYFRPTEVELLLGDPKKAIDAFGFDHEVTSYKSLIKGILSYIYYGICVRFDKNLQLRCFRANFSR